jgi:cytochrome P450
MSSTLVDPNPGTAPQGEPLKKYSEIPVYTPADGRDCLAGHKANPLFSFVEAYRALGPIFRCRYVGTEVVMMGGLPANEAIWANNDYWDYHKSNAHFREQFNDRYLNQLEGTEFYKKRRRTVQGFKPSVLLAQTPGMSRVLFDEIEALRGEPVELRIFSMRLYICMTARVLMQTDLPPGLDRTMAISNRDMLRAPLFGKWRHLFYLKPSRIWRRRKIFAYLGRVLDQRAQSPVAKEDILSLVLAAHPKDEPPIPRQELIYDLSQLMMGGSTTTSQLILWTLIYLSRNPDWLAELREELSSWNPNEFTGMAHFPKLRATLLEMERLRPPGPIVQRISARPFGFHGYEIPAGTKVAHLQTLCHFLPEFYESPREFRPRRFLDNPALPLKNVHGIFAGGAHACVGQPLVRVVAPLLVADIVTRYDLEFTTSVSLDAKLDVVVTPKEKAIVARFVRRKP